MTTLNDGLFYSCLKLNRVVLPNSLNKIGNKVFENCTSLVSISLVGGIKEIGNSAFASCSNLKSIIIPDGVTSLGEEAFEDCASLSSVYIPESVDEIGGMAFYGCKSLTEFSGPLATADGSSLITLEGNLVAYLNRNDYSYVISENVKGIGECVFYDCKNLREISMPESLTYIGAKAFSGCELLKEIRVPRNVKTIGYRAFAYCQNVDCFYFYPLVPPSVYYDYGPYGNDPASSWSGFLHMGNNANLYVPVGAGDAYKRAAGWEEYASVIEELGF